MKNPTLLPLPKLLGWSKEKQERLEIVNKEDFRSEKLTELLGFDNHFVKTLGLTNPDEIKNRQEMIRLMSENKKTSKEIKKSSQRDWSIPMNGEKFIKEFSPALRGNNYSSISTKRIIRLVNLMKEKVEKNFFFHDVKIFCDYISNTINSFIEIEKDFAKKAYEEVKKVATLQGVATFSIQQEGHNHGKISLECGEVFGYKKYSLHTTGRVDQIEKPSSWKPWQWYLLLFSLFPYGLWVVYTNKKRRALRNSAMLIKKLPKPFFDDIATWIVCDLFKITQLHQDNIEYNYDYYDQSLRFRFNLENFKNKFDEMKIKIAITLDPVNKLRVKVVDIDRLGLDLVFYNMNASDFLIELPGYNEGEIFEVESGIANLKKNVRSAFANPGVIYEIINEFKEEGREELLDWCQIPLGKSSENFMYDRLDEIYTMDKLQSLYKEVSLYRRFIKDCLETLVYASNETAPMFAFAEKNGFKLSYPKILPASEHKVSFKSLLPTHLLLEEETVPKKLIPVTSLPSLNGQIVSVTGSNGGGKTVTLVEIAYALYMAQSGLPVFGEGFEFNPKKILGLVFIERGQGSMLELVLKKTKNVFEAIQTEQGSEVLILLDELGTGTQEISGLDLGKKILQSLSSKNVSVLFNTQIPELALFAETELNGMSFKIDPEHLISKGIGRGEPEKLAQKVGLSKFI